MFDARNPFLPQARLAVAVLRNLLDEPALALKGGTAINLLYRDLPRLSVDLDLVYLPVEDRATSHARIAEALRRVARATERSLPRVRVHAQEAALGKLTVQQGRTVTVQVEVNMVLRGSVYAPERRVALPRAQELLGDVSAQALAFEDVYAGKLVAALDRQHPRDLFDVKLLLEQAGLSERLLDAFVVYLASHDRPMSEVLSPAGKDIAAIYEQEFAEMAAEDVSLDKLLEVRARMVSELHRSLLPRQRRFLRSLKALEPDWSQLPVPHAAELPGIKWRLLNLEKFRREQPARYAGACDRLERVLEAMEALPRG